MFNSFWNQNLFIKVRPCTIYLHFTTRDRVENLGMDFYWAQFSQAGNFFECVFLKLEKFSVNAFFLNFGNEFQSKFSFTGAFIENWWARFSQIRSFFTERVFLNFWIVFFAFFNLTGCWLAQFVEYLCTGFFFNFMSAFFSSANFLN